MLKEIKREKYLNKIRPFYNDADIIKILVGIRRCGKSVILEQIMEELQNSKVKEDHIIYINFEYTEFEELLDYKKLNSYVKNKIADNKLYYVFLDEIQYVERFEYVVNSLRASTKNLSIFITGSNSRMLSEELSTELSGRFVSFKISPLSYKEFVELSELDGKNEETLLNYETWGGLPHRVIYTEERALKEYLLDVYNSIIYKDVTKRLGLKDERLFDSLVQYLIDTTGKEFSAENIMNYLKNSGREVSTATLYSYLDALCKAFIIRKVYRRDVQGKAILKTLNKYYMVDLGIAQIKNQNKEINKSMVIENVILNELISRDYAVYIGKAPKGEIDFVAEKDNEIKYIQVAQYLIDDKTIQREFSSFDGIKDNYPKYILTMEKGRDNVNGIIRKNIIDFLLDNEF